MARLCGRRPNMNTPATLEDTSNSEAVVVWTATVLVAAWLAAFSWWVWWAWTYHG